MYSALLERASTGKKIRIAVVGAGRMGLGIARQLRGMPGAELACVADIDRAAAEAAANAYGAPGGHSAPGVRAERSGTVIVSDDALALLTPDGPRIDVVVEATNTIGFAAQVAARALDIGADVVLMNAEVDLALGVWLREAASQRGRIVTSDAGDQHGVLARMIDEMRLWGLEVVMAGNIKGFLDRYATARALAHEAAIRKLNPVQCCAYSDGTKLNIEMALVANGTGLLPDKPGMHGPRAAHVHEALRLFDFDRLKGRGAVDYILGADPGGGVFVVGYSADPLQQDFLQYYKMGDGPFYLFYRPCHLCSFETPLAIAEAVCHRRSILAPRHGRIADVYAYAKRDIAAGETIPIGIGGDHCYGLIDCCANADADGRVPIALLESEGEAMARAKRRIARDQPLRRDDIALPASFLVERFAAMCRGWAA